MTVGFCELFLSPFAIALGAANVTVGLIATLPQVIGDVSQLGTMRLIAVLGSRKRLVSMGIGLQAFALFGMTFVPRLPSFRVFFLLVACILYWVAWMVITPAWQSWMGALVPEDSRGAFFARRNRIVQSVTFVALICGGVILHAFPGEASTRGFLILIKLGILGRLLSLLSIGLQKDIPDSSKKSNVFSFGDFLKTLHRHNYGRFVLYTALFALAVNISGSYFIPYVLEELHLSYVHFMILVAVMVGAKSLTLPVWGQLSDRYGSRKLLALSCGLFCLPPLLVALSPNFYYLAAVQLVAGLGIGGFELCSFNFMLDGTAPEHRTRSAAYYQVLTGLGIITGALIGGFLLRTALLGRNVYVSVFVVSGTIRVLLSLIFLPLIREVREVPHVSYRQLLARLVRFQKAVVE